MKIPKWIWVVAIILLVIWAWNDLKADTTNG